MNAWGHLSGSCHRHLPGRAYYVTCQKDLEFFVTYILEHCPVNDNGAKMKI